MLAATLLVFEFSKSQFFKFTQIYLQKATASVRNLENYMMQLIRRQWLGK